MAEGQANSGRLTAGLRRSSEGLSVSGAGTGRGVTVGVGRAECKLRRKRYSACIRRSFTPLYWLAVGECAFYDDTPQLSQLFHTKNVPQVLYESTDCSLVRQLLAFPFCPDILAAKNLNKLPIHLICSFGMSVAVWEHVRNRIERTNAA